MNIALSERFKYAFRVALAMVITYGISMGLDWDRPFWAALSVIFCSMTTTGASINKGLDRITGTAVAAVVGLLIIAMFPQDRWLFMLAISLFTAFCTYQMAALTPRTQVWLNAGFNVPIIAMLGGMDASQALSPATFDIAMVRLQQTALGAVVYSLVAVLVWPRPGDLDFIDSMRGIARTQHALFAAHIRRLMGVREQGDELEKPMAQVAGQLPFLIGKMEGAAHDSGKVQLAADAWRRHIHNVRSLHTALERFNLGLEDLEGLDTRRYLPGLEQYAAEIDARLAAVASLLGSGHQPREPQVTSLEVDEFALRELSHFQRAAVVSCCDRLNSIADLAASLLRSAGETAGEKPLHASSESGSESAAAGDSGWLIDTDRLITTVRQSTALWLAFLVVIYVPSVPIVVAFIALTNALSMAFGWVPPLPATALLKPVIGGSLLGGVLYIGIMPHLSSFAGFGTMIFLATFAVAYVYSDPRAILLRGIMLTFMVLVISGQNEQSYSFVVFAYWSLVGVMVISVMLVAWRFPISFKAEDRFRAQLRCYLRSAAYLLTDLTGRQATRPGRLHRWQRAFHLHELTVLPSRLKTWSAVLPPTALGETPPAQLERLLNGLQLFSLRMQDLQQQAQPEVMAEEQFAHLQRQAEGLLDSVRDTFLHLARDPAALDEGRSRKLLEAVNDEFSQRVDEALNNVGTDREQGQQIYRLLSTYRGVLGALESIVGGLSAIDWATLREARI